MRRGRRISGNRVEFFFNVSSRSNALSAVLRKRRGQFQSKNPRYIYRLNLGYVLFSLSMNRALYTATAVGKVIL